MRHCNRLEEVEAQVERGRCVRRGSVPFMKLPLGGAKHSSAGVASAVASFFPNPWTPALLSALFLAVPPPNMVSPKISTRNVAGGSAHVGVAAPARINATAVDMSRFISASLLAAKR